VVISTLPCSQGQGLAGGFALFVLHRTFHPCHAGAKGFLTGSVFFGLG
jgi:hypothetical protein